jgi:SAM-dependent methyltransferase
VNIAMPASPLQALAPLLAATALAAAALVTAAVAVGQDVAAPRLDVPYVPTPQPIVDKMLEIASVGPNDVLYDLGCGDGRIVVTAAREKGARGVGIDINPQRIREAQENAKQAGVESKAKFMVGDLFASNFGEATVVTLYLLPDINRRLRPQLWKQLKVGTRVVSHDFDMGPEWPPEKVVNMGAKTIYFWTIAPRHKTATS